MANTTFSGPVRSENGFIGGSKNTTTGAFTNNFEINSSGQYVGTQLQGQGVVATAKVNATAGTNEVTFAQPARSVITSIQLVKHLHPLLLQVTLVTKLELPQAVLN